MPKGASGDIYVGINHRQNNGKAQSDFHPETLGKVVSVQSKLIDARAHGEVSLGSHGFELRSQSTDMSRQDYFDDALVRKKYYPLCSDIVCKATGCPVAVCFHHLVRGHGTGKPFAGMAHSDYSTYTACQLVTGVGVPPDLDVPFKGRICVINLWRNINPQSPIINHYLAMCDGSTLVCPDDFISLDMTDPNTNKPTQTFQLSPVNSRFHRWYYYPEMTADEVLIFTQYDSEPHNKCRYTFHSSVSVNDGTMDYQRESIEVRCLAFFPDAENNTLPDLTLPEGDRVKAAVSSMKELTSYMTQWDVGGQEFMHTHVSNSTLNKFAVDMCQHFRAEKLKPEFKDLTDKQIEEVAKLLDKDTAWKEFMVKVDHEIFKDADKVKNGPCDVEAVVDRLMDECKKVHFWRDEGKAWVLGMKNKKPEDACRDWVIGLCTHKKKEGAPSFSSLKESQFEEVVNVCLKRGMANLLHEQIAKLH